jgi:hypothetical protein
LSTNPQTILDEILKGLKSEEAAGRIAALHELGKIAYSSVAILAQLEQMAVSDPNKEALQLAQTALKAEPQKHVQRTLSSLPRQTRLQILGEINAWQKNGLIQAEQAFVMRARYDFDISQSQPALKTTPDAKADAALKIPSKTAPVPKGPRPTLMQTLLSETSIRVALYLGAFFVVAAALILAALVEAARLPILAAATAIFAGTAIAFRKRLPQPSFALFIVFSFLLTITSNVLSQSLKLGEQANSIYWVMVSFGMAAIWLLGTWLYNSRLFSVTSFLALDAGFLNIAELTSSRGDLLPETYLVMISIAALAGLGGVDLIKRWRDMKFGYPLFGLVQLQTLALVFSAAALVMFRVVEPLSIGFFWLAYAATFAIATAIWTWSNELWKFGLFPYLAAGALVPISWLMVQTLDPEPIGSIASIIGWGLILTATSEIAARFPSTKNFELPLVLASGILFITGSLWGLIEKPLYGFTALTLTAGTYAAMHMLRSRAGLWFASLAAASAAYFTFFDLPFMQGVNLYNEYKLLIPGLLLLGIDLFMKPDFKDHPQWRTPIRIWGTILTAISFLYLPLSEEPFGAALVYLIYAIFFAVYALRYSQSFTGYLASASVPLAVIFFLNYLDRDLWLPALTIIALIYFAGGSTLRGRDPWSILLRNSALVLGSILSIVGLLELKETGGWYALVISVLFAAELFIRRNGLLELPTAVILSIATYLILQDLNVRETPYLFLILTIVWLGMDVILHATFRGVRSLKQLTRGIGALQAVINTAIILFTNDVTSPSTAWICLGISTLFFAGYAWLYRRPQLGYIATAYLPLAMIFLGRDLFKLEWLYPTIAIAVIYYAAGWILRRRSPGKGWDSVMLYSGLGLGTIASTFAPLIGGLAPSIPVAIAATLWAVEAFSRRNVWLGFPANGLYLLAYFMILRGLNVDEPQFFSVGAAALGLLMHYLLTRAGGGTAALVTGMLSQLVLLGTTYLQMLDTAKFSFFLVLFLQSLVVLVYGLVVRSRSLVFMPIGFAVLGVITVVYGQLKGLAPLILIGCTGVILLVLGILAVVLRERISKLGERFSGWQP